MRINFVLLSIIVLMALPTLAQNGSGNEAYLSPGWDTSGPLETGKVSWDDSLPESLSVTFELRGALPSHTYTVGVHLFDPNDLANYPNVDNFLGWFVDRGTSTREGRTATGEAWDFGYLTTDQNGNGGETFSGYVPEGSYYAQFTVRMGSGCRPQEGQSDGCEVVYRTGDIFADGLEEIIIREERERLESDGPTMLGGKGETLGRGDDGEGDDPE